MEGEVNAAPRAYVRGFRSPPCGEDRNRHPRAFVRSVLWHGIKVSRYGRILYGLLSFCVLSAIEIHAQEQPGGRLTLQKNAQPREYQGREVEGEERLIAPGDSLWRILVKEKGVSEKRFTQHLVIIRGLNPQIKNLDVLRVGDNLFIPLRPEELIGLPPAPPRAESARPSRGVIKEYRVKRGEHLYQILRGQLRITTDREVEQYYALVKDLNPERKNWDVLLEGESIRLPEPAAPVDVAGVGAKKTAEAKAAAVPQAAMEAETRTEEKRIVEKSGPPAEMKSAAVPAPAAKAEPRVEAKKLPENTAPPVDVAAVESKQAPEVKSPALPPQRAEARAQEKKPLEKPGLSAAPAPAEEQKPAETRAAAAAPTAGAADPVLRPEIRTIPERTTPPTVGLNYARELPTRENLALLGQIVEALGNEIHRAGEEAVPIRGGTIRIDRTTYPVINNPKLQQKIILDPNDKIPASLKEKLSDRNAYTPVFTIDRSASLQDSVGQLLSQLGYQPMPMDRPVVIQEGGVAFEAKGNWMALAPQVSNKPQEVFVVTLTNSPGDIPAYLRQELARKGLHLKDIVLPSAPALTPVSGVGSKEFAPVIRNWPRDKREFVDAVLLAFGVPFGVSQTVSAELQDGLRMDVRCDRVFERAGQRSALFFQRVEPEIKKMLQEREKTRVIELDLAKLEHKEIVTRLSSELGQRVAYQEHRFAASANNDRLKIAAWGFLLSNQGMFITDREIPQTLHRFFFEKGLEIVYF
jgi:hypothetical protein